MLEAIKSQLVYVVSCMGHFGLAMVLVFIGWWIYDLTTPYKFNDELTEKDNPATGTMLGAYLLGLTLAVIGVITGSGMELNADVARDIAISGGIVIALLRISSVIMDKLVLPQFSIRDEIVGERNLGTAIVVGGGYISTGLVLNAALTGTSESLALGIRDIVVYWLIGQVALILGGIVFQKITKYDVHAEVKTNNVAAALSFGGFLIALGILIRTSVAGAGSDLTAEVGRVLGMLIVGFPMLIAARVIADKILMPGAPISDEVGRQRNAAAGVIAFAVFICVSSLLSFAITSIAGQPL